LRLDAHLRAAIAMSFEAKRATLKVGAAGVGAKP
jgi:hypothetical protein